MKKRPSLRASSHFEQSLCVGGGIKPRIVPSIVVLHEVHTLALDGLGDECFRRSAITFPELGDSAVDGRLVMAVNGERLEAEAFEFRLD